MHEVKGRAMKRFKHEKLKALMGEKGITNEELAKAISMSYRTICRRLSGENFFNTREIMRICNFLGISAKQMPLYFFPIKKGEEIINE